MATDAPLAVERRSELGTSNSRRLRQSGLVPGNLYGLGQESITLSTSEQQLVDRITSGSQVLDLTLDGTDETVMIREVQWDTFLKHILHVDFQRLDKDARVEVTLAITTRGALNEGVLEQPVHGVDISCPVHSVPGNVEVRVGSLKIDDQVTIADLEFPEGIEILTDPETVILRVNEPQELEDIVQEDVLAGAEPEVIGRSADDDEED